MTVRLDDDELTLGPRDAVRIAAGTVRASRNDGAERAALLMVSVRSDDPLAETVEHLDFWPAADDAR